jgi:hypothetical protein
MSQTIVGFLTNRYKFGRSERMLAYATWVVVFLVAAFSVGFVRGMVFTIAYLILTLPLEMVLFIPGLLVASLVLWDWEGAIPRDFKTLKAGVLAQPETLLEGRIRKLLWKEAIGRAVAGGLAFALGIWVLGWLQLTQLRPLFFWAMIASVILSYLDKKATDMRRSIYEVGLGVIGLAVVQALL